MTLTAATVWSLCRAIVITVIAWPICRQQSRWLKSLSERQRFWALWGILVPFLCPELWTGYAWRGFGADLAAGNFWKWFPVSWFSSPAAILNRDAAVDEILVDLLLLARAIPVGTLALFFAPQSSISQRGQYCWRLAKNLGRWNQPPAEPQANHQGARPIGFWKNFRFQWERGATQVPALALMFLATFQEFELVALVNRPAWTMWLFDAQVGGLLLQESLRLAIGPVVCQFLVLVPIGWWIFSSRPAGNTLEESVKPPTLGGRCVVWGALLGGLALLIVIPGYRIGQGIFGGLDRVWHSATQMRMLLHEVFSGMAYALVAAAFSLWTASFFLRRSRQSNWARWVVFGCAAPGLSGSLVMSLVLIQVLQLPVLRMAYKTPLFFALGLALAIWPRAVLVRCLLERAGRPESWHLTHLMQQSPDRSVRGRARELLWRLRWRGEFWGWGVLAYWSFFDLTTSLLLSPVTIVSSPVLLYNQMHFGKNSTLTALVWLTVLIPVSIFGVAAALRRWAFRWFWR